jgi:hypothetical protein
MPKGIKTKFHSARIKEPSQFNDFTYKKNAFGDGIDVVFGIKDGKTEVQSIRFNKNKFTEAEAKEWLKKHPDHKYISFEVATLKEDATVVTTSSDIAQFADKVGPISSRYGDIKKKKSLREMLEHIVDGKTVIS